MTGPSSNIDSTWVDSQIHSYKNVLPKYEKYSEALKLVLSKISKEFDSLSIVETRPKSITSFAEKIVRKWPKYHDPVNQFTDLCGGRIITHTQNQVKSISEIIESNFIIDWDNSIDVQQRLKPTEFGYRSIHYIVQLKPGGLVEEYLKGTLADELFGLKAEVQVRTILEHAWANLYHEWGYKNEFDIPAKLEREMAGLSARLEAADNSFSGIQEELKNYYTSYGAYMNSEQMGTEMEKLELTLNYDPGNLTLIRKLGQLAIAMEDWDRAITLLTNFENSNEPGIIRNLGKALCEKYKNNNKGAEFKKGQRLLLVAGSPPYEDADALSSLAVSLMGIDDKKADEYHRRAYELDPGDASTLGNYLEREIAKEKNLSLIGLVDPVIHKAIERSISCINVGINLPRAYFDIGKLKLLLNEPYDSFSAYAKGIDLSSSYSMIESSFQSIKRLDIVNNLLEGYQWIENLFWLGSAVKFAIKGATDEIDKRSLSKTRKIDSSIIILAGGSEKDVLHRMESYRPMLLIAFQDFQGTIISGGTTVGISKLTGDLKAKYPGNISALGYMPRKASVETEKNPDRYNEIRRTDGEQFSPLEATQYWLDIFSSGVKVEDVRLLVIGGGKISLAECKLALILGAKVGIIEGSGGETAKLFSDPDWNNSKGLIQLPDDAEIINSFIAERHSEMKKELREDLARMIHEEYRKEIISDPEPSDPSLAKWEDLKDSLKESNRSQSRHIFEKLKRIGCAVNEVKDRKVKLIRFSDPEIERMAEMEHARWVVERLSDGWKPAAKKDVDKKLSPYLVSWDLLSEKIRDLDRNTVKEIPEYLAAVGLEIYRPKQKSQYQT